MKHLINREDYIKEYLHISNHIESERDNELYEGLLNTLFGGLKMLLKKDWSGIKCKNPSVLKYLQEIDKSLSGYTMTKMEFSNECKMIRQNIADYFNDILEYKLSQIDKAEDKEKFFKQEEKEIKDKDNKKKGVAKKLNIKDKALMDSIDKYKENISSACKVSAKLREYADLMMKSVDVFVNDQIIAQYDKFFDDKKKKEIEEQRKKAYEEWKVKSEEERKIAEEEMKKLSAARDKEMKALKVNLIGPMNGDKAIDTIVDQFTKTVNNVNDIDIDLEKIGEFDLNNELKKMLSLDTYVGIKDSFEQINWGDKKEDKLRGIFLSKIILNKMNTAFNIVKGNHIKSLFKSIPSASVQAMFVSLANVILNGFVKDDFKLDDKRAIMMARCAIVSDRTVGFCLPSLNTSLAKNNSDESNIFLSIMDELRSGNVSKEEIETVVDSLKKDKIKTAVAKSLGGKDKTYFEKWAKIKMGEFAQNISKTYSEIIMPKAKELKEAAQKEREKEAQRAEQQSQATENKTA